MFSQATALSHVGQKRSRNEDAYAVDEALGLYVVSDGMGGHAAGDVASRKAVDVVCAAVKESAEVIDRVRRREGEAAELAQLLGVAVQRACREVHRLASANPALHGMGATLTALLVAGSHGALAHVGDSRLYLYRDSEVHQMTADHTMAAELVKTGHIKPEDAAKGRMSHVLTRAIGSQESVRVDTLAMDVFPNDRFVLCTDGLSNYVPERQWLASHLSGGSIEAAARALLDHANASGGHDNITVLVVRLGAEEADRPAISELSAAVKTQLDALSSVFLFEGLPLPQLVRVFNACGVVECAAGQVVTKQGARADCLFVIRTGDFELLRDGQVVARLGPGDHAGAGALLTPRKALATLRARTGGEILHLDRETFRTLVRARPWLGVALLERLGGRLDAELSSALTRLQGGSAAAAPGELF